MRTRQEPHSSFPVAIDTACPFVTKSETRSSVSQFKYKELKPLQKHTQRLRSRSLISGTSVAQSEILERGEVLAVEKVRAECHETALPVSAGAFYIHVFSYEYEEALGTSHSTWET